MHRPKQRNEGKPAGGYARWSAWLLVALGAAGCSHTHSLGNVGPTEDPLKQTPVLPVPNDPHTAPGAAPTQGAAVIPPLPSSPAATNTATLASGSGNRWGRALAIPDPAPPPAAAPATLPGPMQSGAAPPALPPPDPSPRVREVPAESAAAPGVAIQTAGSWASPDSAGAGAITTDNFARLLADHGYTLQHLRQASLGQGIHVTCIASYRGAAEANVFEVTAADFDAAGRAILREADRRGTGK